MEDGQKFPISLDSSLDVNSNDMLVATQQPKFAFNRQRYLGSLLQTSVRYEADGWFVGWYGHNFDIKTTGDSRIEPTLGNPDITQIYSRTVPNYGWTYYDVRQRDVGVEFSFNLEQQETWYLTDEVGGKGTITREGDEWVRVTGKTTKGTPYSVLLNVYDTSWDEANSTVPDGFSVRHTKTGVVTHFELYVNKELGDDYVRIRTDRPTNYNGTELVYSYANGVSTWGLSSTSPLFRLTDAGVFTSLVSTVTVNSYSIVNGGLETEYCTAVFQNQATANAVVNVGIQITETPLPDKWSRLRWGFAQFQNQWVGGNGAPVRGNAGYANGRGGNGVGQNSAYRAQSNYEDYTVVGPWTENGNYGYDCGQSYNLSHWWRIETVVVNAVPSGSQPIPSVPFYDLTYPFGMTTAGSIQFVYGFPVWIRIKLVMDWWEDSGSNGNVHFRVKEFTTNFMGKGSMPMRLDYTLKSYVSTTVAANIKSGSVSNGGSMAEVTVPKYVQSGMSSNNSYLQLAIHVTQPGWELNALSTGIVTWQGPRSSITASTLGGGAAAYFYGTTYSPWLGLPFIAGAGVLRLNGLNIQDGRTWNNKAANDELVKLNANEFTLYIPFSTIGWVKAQLNATTTSMAAERLEDRLTITLPANGSSINSDQNSPPYNYQLLRIDGSANFSAFKLVNIAISNLETAQTTIFSIERDGNSENALAKLAEWRAAQTQDPIQLYYARVAFTSTSNSYFSLITADALTSSRYDTDIENNAYPAWVIEGSVSTSKRVESGAARLLRCGAVNDSTRRYQCSQWEARGATTNSFVDIGFMVETTAGQTAKEYALMSASAGGVFPIGDPSGLALFDDVSMSTSLLTSGNTNVGFQVWLDAQRTNYVLLGYNPSSNTLSVQQANVNKWGYVGTTLPNLNNGTGDVLITLRNLKTETANFYKTFILKKAGLGVNASIVSQSTAGVIDFNTGFGQFDLRRFRFSKRTNESLQVSYEYADVDEYTTTLIYGDPNRLDMEFMPACIIRRNTPRITSVRSLPNGKVFKYDGKEYQIIIDFTATAFLSYSRTDIRTGGTKVIYNRSLNDIVMFIKQFWSSTVDTENFWWLDATHVMELTKADMYLWRKITDNTLPIGQRIHDWNGDQWIIEKYCSRGFWIQTEDLAYGVSCAYDTTPVFYKLRESGSGIAAVYIDPLTPGWDWATPVWKTAAIPVRSGIPLGSPCANGSSIGSHLTLNRAALITSAKISASCVGQTFILGIALDRGLNQWAIRINKSSGSIQVVTGYGHVGLDGSLTGGQLPTSACSPTTGFNATVRPLSDLASVTDFRNGGTFGTGTRVWFIRDTINDIVSHFTFNGNTHTSVAISLTSNITRQYEDYSFAGWCAANIEKFRNEISISGFLGLSGLLGSVMRVLESIALPPVLTYNPQLACLAFLNHSWGQYAYVYRNDTTEHVSATETDRDIKFAVDTRAKAINLSPIRAAGSVMGHWGAIFSLLLTGVQIADTAISERYFANNAQNQSTTDDSKGRKWSQFAVDNVTSMVLNAFTSTGPNISLNSPMVMSATLDMFYSISNKSQCWAGPGFVNHNFIGQCIAQSNTDLQVKGIRIGYFVVLKSVSLAIGKAQGWLAKVLESALSNAAEYLGEMSGNTHTGALTAIVPTGIVLGALGAVARALHTYREFQESVAQPFIAGVCDSLGSQGQSYDAGGISNFKNSIEYTHTYGNKPISFLWPCFGIVDLISYTNEYVSSAHIDTKADLEFDVPGISFSLPSIGTKIADINANFANTLKGTAYSTSIMCEGVADAVTAVKDMAVVEGASTCLSSTPFKNEQIGVSAPAFPPPAIQDYCIDQRWQIGLTGVAGEVNAVTVDDTKIIDGMYSNIVRHNDFCGIAAPYTAIEVKDEYDEKYLRPIAITPTALGLNINRMNVVHEGKAYHGFDGHGNRIVHWRGGSGMDKAMLYQQYAFFINDHFKTSSILPPSQYMGIFTGPPTLAMRGYDKVANIVQSLGQQEGLDNNIPGEQKDLRRNSIPVHTELLSTLPTVVRALTPYRLNVVEGVTSITTDLRNTQSAYKAPSSVDFAINGTPYRFTSEYINELRNESGMVAVTDIVATAGLTFIGATTKEAFFYSPATKLYYSFSGQRDINKVDIINRFSDFQEGRWDFVNQEVVFKCLLSDGQTLVTRLDNGFLGEVFPPIETIYNERSGFKLYSMAGGTVYQGPTRFIVNRFSILDHMYDDIVSYTRTWKKVSRDKYSQYRDYHWKYEDVTTRGPLGSIDGWTHNPFGLVTSMLGISEDTDNKFEWELTFAWTEQMEHLYTQNEYVTVNLQAETVTQGGVLMSDVTHVFLFKECFTRDGNAGYYTFQFQSNNGIGNRERLYVWSDGIIALEDINLTCKNITTRRTQPLHTQVDVKDLREL